VVLAREVQEARFEPRVIRYGFREGVVGITWNAPLLARLGPDLRSEADALVAEIEAGTLRVPRGY